VGAFDLKSALLARHAQHVVLIHFPIALFLVGVLFDCVAHFTKRAAFATVASFNIITAAVFVIPVLVTGLLAWRWQLEGQRLHGPLLLHLVFGCVSGILILATAFLHWRERKQEEGAGWRLRLPLEAFAALVVMATAHLGGIVAGVNGPG
jgi:uncharacterized membrane protein